MDKLIATSHSISLKVEPQHTAMYVGSGDMDVLATPIMIALMENCAMMLLAPSLKDGESSVGTMINCNHNRATPQGKTITATATITKIDGRAVEFLIEATDDKGVIGNAVHTRFIVNKEKFLGKLKD
ncbi:MAG: thioesterase family protein [Rikenellaceae bacterium]